MTGQYVIQARSGGAAENGLPPLGTREDISRQLSRFNTSDDGVDHDVFHGPGIRIELPPGTESSLPVNQMLLIVNEQEIGWLVLQKLAHELKWTIVDPGSGREWNP